MERRYCPKTGAECINPECVSGCKADEVIESLREIKRTQIPGSICSYYLLEEVYSVGQVNALRKLVDAPLVPETEPEERLDPFREWAKGFGIEFDL
jgi:hypothetical protein